MEQIFILHRIKTSEKSIQDIYNGNSYSHNEYSVIMNIADSFDRT